MHVHSEYAPPRSWDQFEELCADVFQSAWRDPALVRHGRAGQRQHGVDIVGRNGSIYPIGLQCKKKSRWPISKLTSKQIDDEVAEARNFTPPLKSFYILTTAPDDSKLQAHVRAINVSQKKAKSFEVILLGWDEIVRRATRDPEVATKHFGPNGGGPRSPLLGVWYLSNGGLEGKKDELDVGIRELMQDIVDYPTGHIVVRQRESDILLEKIASFAGRPLKIAERKARIALRDELQRLTRQETNAISGIKLMLTNPEMADWLLEIWKPDRPSVLFPRSSTPKYPER